MDGAIVAEKLEGMEMSPDDSLFYNDMIPKHPPRESEYEELVREFEETLLAEFMGYSQLKSEIDLESRRDLEDLEEICRNGGLYYPFHGLRLNSPVFSTADKISDPSALPPAARLWRVLDILEIVVSC